MGESLFDLEAAKLGHRIVTNDKMLVRDPDGPNESSVIMAYSIACRCGWTTTHHTKGHVEMRGRWVGHVVTTTTEERYI